MSNPINNLSLEAQLHYQNTIRQIDQMSPQQLKEFTILLFQSYTMQHNFIKDILKNQVMDDIHHIKYHEE